MHHDWKQNPWAAPHCHPAMLQIVCQETPETLRWNPKGPTARQTLMLPIGPGSWKWTKKKTGGLCFCPHTGGEGVLALRTIGASPMSPQKIAQRQPAAPPARWRWGDTEALCPPGTLANPDVATPSSVPFWVFFLCYFGPIYVFLALLPIKAKEQNWWKTWVLMFLAFLLDG